MYIDFVNKYLSFIRWANEKEQENLWQVEGIITKHSNQFLKFDISFLKSYNQILEVGKGWEWKDKHYLNTDKGRVLFGHSFSSDISKAVAQYSMSVVQGHYHTVSEIKFLGNDFHLNFGMTVGCLVDVKALSMSYMKLNLKKPILSCGLITDGMPHLTPMYLKKNGSWDGNIYI